MRFILLLLTFTISIPSFTKAQDLLEIFEVGQHNNEGDNNFKYGLVNRKTLEEVLAPIYDPNNFGEYNKYYLAIQDDTLRVFDKPTSEKYEYRLRGKERMKCAAGKCLFYISSNGNSAFLDLDSLDVIPTKHDYEMIQSMGKYIIAKRKGYFDLYDFSGNKTQPVKNINAMYVGSWMNYSDFSYTYLFYGGKHTYIYDNGGNLIKTIKKKITTSEQAEELYNTQIRKEEIPGLLPPVAGTGSYEPAWELKRTEMGNNYYLSKNSKANYYIKTSSSVQYYPSRHQNKVCFGTSDGTKYQFKIDEEEKKAILPLKYQGELRLSIVPIERKRKGVEQQAKIEGSSVESVVEKHLVYPKLAKKKKIEGEVVVSVTIDTLHKIKSYEVLKSLGYGCDEEAIRLIKSYLYFKPAIIGKEDEFGFMNIQKYESQLNITIPFDLSKEKERSKRK